MDISLLSKQTSKSWRHCEWVCFMWKYSCHVHLHICLKLPNLKHFHPINVYKNVVILASVKSYQVHSFLFDNCHTPRGMSMLVDVENTSYFTVQRIINRRRTVHFGDLVMSYKQSKSSKLLTEFHLKWNIMSFLLCFLISSGHCPWWEIKLH